MVDNSTRTHGIRDVAVVGGGLAGLSTACALVESGYRVHLIERRPYVGGRASSYEHPGTGEVVDNCQHVLLGCCTNLIAFYRQLGVADRIRWFDRITFLEPGGRKSLLSPGSLPAPLHNAVSFLRSSAFSMADKLAISRGMLAFLRGVPQDDGENFAAWLARHGQTRRAIDRFWNPVLVSALNEDLDRVSVHYAAMVFRTSFMQSAQAGWMGVPTIPLSELYSHAVGFIQSHGGEVSLRKSVESFDYDDRNHRWRVGFDGGSVEADAVVLAVPFESMQKLLPQLPGQIDDAPDRLAQQLEHFQHSPITGIHLWFDRPVTDLEHAVLLDTTIQWMYNKSLLQPKAARGRSRKLSGTGGERVEVAGTKISPGDNRSGIAGVGRILSSGARSKAVEGRGHERSARNIFCYARARCVPAWSNDCMATIISGRGLDGDRLAINDGRRGAQRVSCGGGFDASGWESAEISASRFTCAGVDAVVSVEILTILSAEKKYTRTDTHGCEPAAMVHIFFQNPLGRKSICHKRQSRGCWSDQTDVCPAEREQQREETQRHAEQAAKETGIPQHSQNGSFEAGMVADHVEISDLTHGPGDQNIACGRHCDDDANHQPDRWSCERFHAEGPFCWLVASTATGVSSSEIS